jgi:hypothetical protein
VGAVVLAAIAQIARRAGPAVGVPLSVGHATPPLVVASSWAAIQRMTSSRR